MAVVVAVFLEQNYFHELGREIRDVAKQPVLVILGKEQPERHTVPIRNQKGFRHAFQDGSTRDENRNCQDGNEHRRPEQQILLQFYSTVTAGAGCIDHVDLSYIASA